MSQFDCMQANTVFHKIHHLVGATPSLF